MGFFGGRTFSPWVVPADIIGEQPGIFPELQIRMETIGMILSFTGLPLGCGGPMLKVVQLVGVQ